MQAKGVGLMCIAVYGRYAGNVLVVRKSQAGKIKTIADLKEKKIGVSSPGSATHNFVAHYHTERNHQGLANRLISPESGHLGNAGVVQRRQRLGGMLNYYYRAAA